jgi:hypothetical protein
MEIKTLENLLNKSFNDMEPYYIGIFVKGKVIVSKYIKKSEKLEDYFSRMIERSLEINTAIKNFSAEFLFSGGKDFSIMIYYTTAEIAIGIIHIGKPNFSLLKITAQDLAKELKKYEKDLLLYYEEYLKPTEEQLNSEEKENYQTDTDESEKVLTGQAEENIQKKINIPEDILKPTEDTLKAYEPKENTSGEKFNKVRRFFASLRMTNKKDLLLNSMKITNSSPKVWKAYEPKENTSGEKFNKVRRFFASLRMTNKKDLLLNSMKITNFSPKVSKAYEPKENDITENKPPSLEEILSMESYTEKEPVAPVPSVNEILKPNLPKEDNLPENNLSGIDSDIDNILNKIEKEFVGIIGPFGKYIFKKSKEEFLKKDNITKFSVLKFIHSLAEEIPEIKKRDLFIENAKKFLSNL